MWFGGKRLQNLPIHHFQETCVTVTWLKLSEQLLRLTGEGKYADEFEKTYYNALLGSMSGHGATWAKYTPLNGQRLPGSEQCGMGLNCCEASGPRALFRIPRDIVMERKEGLQVNYFADGKFELKTPQGNHIELIQHSFYPKSGNIEMTIDLQKSESFEICIRIPEWSKKTKLTINGLAVENLQVGRSWPASIAIGNLVIRISIELDISEGLLRRVERFA